MVGAREELASVTEDALAVEHIVLMAGSIAAKQDPYFPFATAVESGTFAPRCVYLPRYNELGPCSRSPEEIQ
jgi:hypothetical protein